MKRFELFVARRYLWAQRKTFSSGLIVLFSLLGVCIGTWLLIFVLSASNGFELEVKKQMINKDAHFELNKYDYIPIANPDSVADYISKNVDVISVSPYVVSQAVFAHKKKFSGGMVFGIHPERSLDVIGLKGQMKEGRYHLDSIADPRGLEYPAIIMGYALAARLGLEIGERCFLYVFDEETAMGMSIAPKVKPLVLAGTFESGMYQFDESLAYIHLQTAQSIFNLGKNVTGIHAKVKNPMESGKVARIIERDMGYPYVVTDWQEKNKTLIKWMDYEKVLIGLALGIIIIIAAFNIISSLVMNVNDKRREIGILRAMGATKTGILRIFIFEGFLIGLVGSVIGMCLGLASCYIQQTFGIITLPGDVYFVTTLPVVAQFSDILSVMLITNLLCIVAGVLPAFLAAHHHPVDSIRYE